MNTTAKSPKDLQVGDVVIYAHGEYPVLHVQPGRYKTNVLFQGKHGKFERDADNTKALTVKASA